MAPPGLVMTPTTRSESWYICSDRSIGTTEEKAASGQPLLPRYPRRHGILSPLRAYLCATPRVLLLLYRMCLDQNKCQAFLCRESANDQLRRFPRRLDEEPNGARGGNE